MRLRLVQHFYCLCCRCALIDETLRLVLGRNTQLIGVEYEHTRWTDTRVRLERVLNASCDLIEGFVGSEHALDAHFVLRGCFSS